MSRLNGRGTMHWNGAGTIDVELIYFKQGSPSDFNYAVCLRMLMTLLQKRI